MVPNLMNIEQAQTKHELRIRQLIIHGLVEVLELFPQYTIGQHLSYLTDKNIFKFTDEQVLKVLEKYKDKLEDEVLEGEEIYFEEEL